MKKVFWYKLIITGLLAFLLGLASCEKLYPDDIPEWLKKKIKDEIKSSIHFDYVIELRSDSAAMPVYQVIYAGLTGGNYYYDYYGQRQCYCKFPSDLDTCGNIACFPSYKNYRIIYND
jgi:hypothetical protein